MASRPMDLAQRVGQALSTLERMRPAVLSMLLAALGVAGAGAVVLILAGDPAHLLEEALPQPLDDTPAQSRPSLNPGPEPEPFDSTALRAPPQSGAPALVVHGSGWGHGVGMSQYGAQAQALAGRTHEEILSYYYRGTDLVEAPEVDDQIRVNLFLNRGDIDRSELQIRSSSRDGGPPDRNVTVELGEGEPIEVPWPQTWTLTADAAAGDLVLRDSRGEERRRRAGPARVRYEHPEGNQTLLRLPQLVQPRSATHRLTGTFAWGELEVTHGGGQIQPVVIVPLERYLRGIAEVPSGWEPAALAAQAVAARTYAIRQMRQPLGATCRCHLGATPHHQVYAGYVKEGVPIGSRWRDAVDASTGQVVVYDGDLAWTYYSSSHGGRSDHSEDSWAYSSALPYLRSVDDPWSLDEAVNNPFASWRRTITNAELVALVGRGLAEVRGVRVVERTDGGSPRVLEVRGVDADDETIRFLWDGDGAGSAATALKRHFRARLPSQQISAIGLEPFHDDAGREGEYELLVAHRNGLIHGCDEGRRKLCPDGAVTRAEVAIGLLRARSGGRADIGSAIGVVDAAQAVETAVADDLLAACEGGCLDEPVTRAELAAGLQAAADLQGVVPAYADATAHERAEAIGATTDAGLLAACGPDSFCPDSSASRLDLARALVLGFDLD